MHMLEKIIATFAPHACLGCEAEENKLLCDGCRQALPSLPSRCYRCHAITRDYAVCETCSRNSSLRRVQAVTTYEGLAKELLHRAKYERAQSGLAEIAAHMSEAYAPYFVDDILFVPTPTATSRVRQRGYDHAVLIAKHMARLTGAPAATLLVRTNQAHQVGASKTARFQHMQEAFRATHVSRLKDAHIVLIDDVTTTGATLEAAARLCKKHGARRVDALVFAQAL